MPNFNDIDPTEVTLLVTALVLGGAIVGYLIGRRHPRPGVKSWSSDALQQATFTIVGLLLAFTFSLALARFDARRIAVVNESNAITGTILHTELLEPGTARTLRADLRAYLHVREASLAPDTSSSQRQSADQQIKTLQLSMRRHAAAATRAQPSPIAVFFLTSLGQTFDAASQQDAAAEAHIPVVVLLLLLLVVLTAVSFLGFRTGRLADQSLAPTILLAVLLALVLAAIIDFDRPQQGVTRIDFKALTDASALLAAEEHNAGER